MSSIIKHKDMLAQMATGEPFNITYCKKKGELTEFTGAKMRVKQSAADEAATHMQRIHDRRGGHNARAARNTTAYESLIPIETANEEIREIHTRAIVKFNGMEVVL
jgi:hypothetical protein